MYGLSAKGALHARYVINNYMVGDDFFSLLGKSAETRRRFLAVNTPTTTVANAKLTMHYNEKFTPKVPLTASPGAVYDAVYVIAYALPMWSRKSGDSKPQSQPLFISVAFWRERS